MIRVVKRNLLVPKAAGVWVSDDYPWIWARSCITIINVTIHVYSIVGCCLEGYFKETNFEKFSFLLYTMMLNQCCILRTFLTIRHIKRLKSILYDLDEGIIVKHSITESEKVVLRKTESVILKYSNAYLLGGIFGCVSVCFSPAVERILLYLEVITPGGEEKNYPFPLYVWYDDTIMINYLIGYFVHCCASLSMLCTWLGLDVTFASLVTHICAHLDLISNRLRNLGYEEEKRNQRLNSGLCQETSTTSQDKEKLKKSINSIAEYHWDVIR